MMRPAVTSAAVDGGASQADGDRPVGGGVSARLDAVRGAVLGGFVLVALLLGGGGAATPPTFSLAIQLAGLATIALTVTAIWSRHLDDRARSLLALGIVTAITLAAQLVPLPPGMWQALPGRELATEVRRLVGASDRWLPFSLDPDATREAGLAFIAPAAAFLGVLYAGVRTRLNVIRLVVVLAAADLLLSVWQFTAGMDAALTPYRTLHAGSAIGFFANRNHNADLLLVAGLLALGLAQLDRGRRLGGHNRAVMLVILVAALLGVFITASRTGILLSAVLILGGAMLLASRGRHGHGHVPRSWLVTMALILLVALAGAVFLLRDNAVAQSIMSRFEVRDDPRFLFWPDVTYAIGQFWPAGTGTGTFATVFKTVERLDAVGEFYVNHAHNDYLEVTLALGLWGAVLMAMYLVAIGRAIYLSLRLRDPGPIDSISTAAAFAIFIFLLHAAVDYPLRTQALAVLMGICSGLLFRPAIPIDRLVPLYSRPVRDAA